MWRAAYFTEAVFLWSDEDWTLCKGNHKSILGSGPAFIPLQLSKLDIFFDQNEPNINLFYYQACPASNFPGVTLSWCQIVLGVESSANMSVVNLSQVSNCPGVKLSRDPKLVTAEFLKGTQRRHSKVCKTLMNFWWASGELLVSSSGEILWSGLVWSGLVRFGQVGSGWPTESWLVDQLNVIFKILTHPAFWKYSTCWVF